MSWSYFFMVWALRSWIRLSMTRIPKRNPMIPWITTKAVPMNELIKTKYKFIWNTPSQYYFRMKYVPSSSDFIIFYRTWTFVLTYCRSINLSNEKMIFMNKNILYQGFMILADTDSIRTPREVVLLRWCLSEVLGVGQELLVFLSVQVQ